MAQVPTAMWYCQPWPPADGPGHQLPATCPNYARELCWSQSYARELCQRAMPELYPGGCQLLLLLLLPFALLDAAASPAAFAAFRVARQELFSLPWFWRRSMQASCILGNAIKQMTM